MNKQMTDPHGFPLLACFLGAVLLAFAAPIVAGQAAPEVTGAIDVSVRDNTGVIRGATVRVTHVASAASWRQLTDASGGASFAALGSSFHSAHPEALVGLHREKRLSKCSPAKGDDREA